MELVQYSFTIPGVTVFLSNRLCQDPLEKFFGQQRQRGRTNENPNAKDFLKNTQALHVVNSTCGTIRGNCRGNSTEHKQLEAECTPLSKRKGNIIKNLYVCISCKFIVVSVSMLCIIM